MSFSKKNCFNRSHCIHLRAIFVTINKNTLFLQRKVTEKHGRTMKIRCKDKAGSTALSFKRVVCCQKLSFSFVLTTNWTKETNPIAGINERWRSPNESEFSRDTQHVDVERFVSFAERLRSLSCFVDLFYWFHSLLNNNVLKWKSRGLVQ